MSYRMLRGKGKPFPYREVYTNSPKMGVILGTSARNAGDGVPYRGYANSPGVV